VDEGCSKAIPQVLLLLAAKSGPPLMYRTAADRYSSIVAAYEADELLGLAS
jgi:hypothetical protein